MTLLIAGYGVVSHWGVWSYGVYAMGWNTTAYWAGLWFLLLSHNGNVSLQKNWRWLVPLWLIVLSFALFENPWLKLISVAVLPLATGIFYAFGQLQNQQQLFWGWHLLKYLLSKTFSPLSYLFASSQLCQNALLGSLNQHNRSVSRRIVKGILLLLPVAMFVVVLLASADAKFGALIDVIFSALFKHFNWELFAKAIITAGLTIVLLAVIYGWHVDGSYSEHKQQRTLDDIVVGIVMGGVLAIYCLFLYLQLEYLLVDTLPIELAQAEHLVKSGFWQLFFLSILNVVLFFFIYKNTTALTQSILRIFIVASGLILLSACWRMGLYVYWYGLSYEKFFASYTAIYAVLVFSFLLFATFSQIRKDIFRFMAFSSLWFYAIATILPIEKIIFNANQVLSEQTDSRVNLYHLSDLSADILKEVKTAAVEGRINAVLWRQWINEKEQQRCQRHWYETNLSLVLNCAGSRAYQ